MARYAQVSDANRARFNGLAAWFPNPLALVMAIFVCAAVWRIMGIVIGKDEGELYRDYYIVG